MPTGGGCANLGGMPETKPPYLVIRDELAGRIAAGDLPPGARLPTVRELMAAYGVARATADRVVRLLAAEGLVVTRGRGGTIVAEVGPSRLVLGPQQRFGRPGPVPGERVQVTGSAMVDAPDYIMPILGLEEVRPGEVHVWRREQLVRDPAGEPLRLEVSWFSPRWAEAVPHLASADVPVSSMGGVAWEVAAASGDPVVKVTVGFETRPARRDGREAPALGQDWLQAVVYTWQTRGGQVAEYGEFIEPPRRVLEVTADVPGPAEEGEFSW